MKTEYCCCRKNKYYQTKIYILILVLISIIRIVSLNIQQENYVEAFEILGSGLFSEQKFDKTVRNAYIAAFSVRDKEYIYVDGNYSEEIFEY